MLQQKLKERSASPVPQFDRSPIGAQKEENGPQNQKYQLDYSPNAKITTMGYASTQEQTTKMENDQATTG